MHLKIDIDGDSGFCYGVVRAIGKAEEFLSAHGRLYSLGAIVHNETEMERLARKGLETISYADFLSGEAGQGTDILIRAHGEPPETYAIAAEKGYRIIDCTCPVVLRLQEKIRAAAKRMGSGGCIMIFGKTGHAEVNGLVGQAEAEGCPVYVVENSGMLRSLIAGGELARFGGVEIFSQTTKDPAEYREICRELIAAVPSAKANDTICGQVASRHRKLAEFAGNHDVVLFVSGKESSNGKVLYRLCLDVNPRTHFIGDEGDIREEWFSDGDNVGICGATSTPKWLLEKIADYMRKYL